MSVSKVLNSFLLTGILCAIGLPRSREGNGSNVMSTATPPSSQPSNQSTWFPNVNSASSGSGSIKPNSSGLLHDIELEIAQVYKYTQQGIQKALQPILPPNCNRLAKEVLATVIIDKMRTEFSIGIDTEADSPNDPLNLAAKLIADILTGNGKSGIAKFKQLEKPIQYEVARYIHHLLFKATGRL